MRIDSAKLYKPHFGMIEGGSSYETYEQNNELQKGINIQRIFADEPRKEPPKLNLQRIFADTPKQAENSAADALSRLLDFFRR